MCYHRDEGIVNGIRGQDRLGGSVMDGFDGMRVAALESRRAEEMQRLIAKHGGEPLVVPAMREVVDAENRHAIDYVHRLITGQVDLTIFLTGVGFRYLLELAARHVDRQRYLDGLTDTVTVARGPKPAAAMRRAGVEPTWTTNAPHTWREILTLLDQHAAAAQQTVAVQEYGARNTSLIAGLEARGARVLQVPIYRWEMPRDLRELKNLCHAMAGGEIDVVLVTAAQQIVHLAAVARDEGILDRVKDAGRRMVVAAVGPTTGEAISDALGWTIDLVAEPAKMGHLVAQAACHARSLRERKLAIDEVLAATKERPSQRREPWDDSLFMRAVRGERTEMTPIWLMRQAGRYMAEYRAVRADVSFMELCRNPQLASEVMCVAVDKLGVDAAIIFSDLLPILEPMGLDLEFVTESGPTIHNPVREPSDVERVREIESLEALEFVIETVRQTRRDLPDRLPLIGFGGAPFTLASYLIEGGSSRHYLHTKTLMYRDEAAWNELMSRLARSITRYLNAQIGAGAQCVQLFDSWVGCLGPADYRRFVLPHVREIVQHVSPHAPVIYFATGNPQLLEPMAESGSRVIGVDWRIELDDAWQRIGLDRSIQGNLDPALLLADPSTIRQAARRLLDQAAGRPGHIFNLGHGVLPQTPVEHAQMLVQAVHELSGG